MATVGWLRCGESVIKLTIRGGECSFCAQRAVVTHVDSLEISQPKSDNGTDEDVASAVDVYVNVNVRNVTCDRNVRTLATGST